MTNKNHDNSVDIVALARQTMIDEGFQPDFSAAVMAEVKRDAQQSSDSPGSAVDLRKVMWSSIDNNSSRDLDQIEFIESVDGDRFRVRIGVADVDGYAKKDSAVDQHAAQNTTSVYTGVVTFPMLPEELSTDLTSLVADEDRHAIVIEFQIAKDGSTSDTKVYAALVHNYAKLAYESVGHWLDNSGAVPAQVAKVDGLDQQIKLQAEASTRLRELRRRQGALDLTTIQPSVVINDQGEIIDLALDDVNSARDIIENFMVAANVAMAEFLGQHNVVSLRRVVRTPENWERITEVAKELGEELPDQPDARALDEFLGRRKQADPLRFPDLSLTIVKLLGPGDYVVQIPGQQGEGHFGLAVHNYTHSTAPNRRFPDLVTQRLLKACLAGESQPYSVEDLEKIAEHCNERESAARKVERKMRKVAAAHFLRDRIGEEFDAIVTGVTPKGTFARAIKPPVDGLIVSGKQHLKVGQHIRVRLVEVDQARGFIDFAAIGDSRR